MEFEDDERFQERYKKWLMNSGFICTACSGVVLEENEFKSFLEWYTKNAGDHHFADTADLVDDFTKTKIVIGNDIDLN